MSPQEAADFVLAGREIKELGEADAWSALFEIAARAKAGSTGPAVDSAKLKADLSAATARAEKAESELASLRTENAKLKAKDAEFESRVHLEAARELCRIGIRDTSATSTFSSDSKPPTVTELCVAEMARGATTAPVHKPVPPAAQSVDDGDEE